MHHVIIGAGPAGVVAAETLRRYDPQSEITLLGGEPEPPYSRMAIPYLLVENIDETGTYLRQTAGHYESLGIRYRQGRAAGIFSGHKLVRLEDGSDIHYDKLLVATGATPIAPPIPGLDLPGVHNCWTLEDARNISRLTSSGDPVVLVGAGFIGSIILEALVRRGVQLTVVEMGDRMVPRMMDDVAGGMLRRWCENKGVRVLTSTMVERIDQNANGLLQVKASTGDTLDARLVVVAAGVRPNIGFLASTGITIDQGIMTDEYLATSVKDVYAAGDVAQAKDLSTGKYEMLAIQPVAVEHGRIAALNMAGRPTVHRGSLNMNVLDTLGLISSSFGLWQGAPGGESSKLTDERRYKYMRLEFDQDKLVGFQAVGVTDHIGMARGLIQTGLSLGHWKEKLMASPERLPEAYIATQSGA